MESKIDSIVEAARDRDVDAIIDTPFEIVGDAPHVYTAKTWHNDCPDFIVSNDIIKNDEMRRNIAKVLFNLREDHYARGDTSKMVDAQCIAMYLTNIGQLVVESCIANGLTEETVGERY